MQQMPRDDSEEQYIGKYEVVFGQHIANTNPLLSPKFKQLIDEFSQISKINEAMPVASTRITATA